MVDTPGHADFGGEVSIYFMKIFGGQVFLLFFSFCVSFLSVQSVNVRYINHIEVTTRIGNYTITLGFKCFSV